LTFSAEISTKIH